MKFSFAALFAALSVSNVAAECPAGTVVKTLGFDTDSNNNPIDASCDWRRFQGECVADDGYSNGHDSLCYTRSNLYPTGFTGHDCVNGSGGPEGYQGRVCACSVPGLPVASENKVACGCLKEGFQPPGWASTITFPHGMTVTAREAGNTADERAVLFDSTQDMWTGNDSDLQVNLGNLLIINTNNNFWNPDDSATGGWMKMMFASPVRVDSVVYADIESSESGKLYANGQNELMVPAVEDGKSGEVDYEQEGVTELKLVLSHTSGAIAKVKICVPDDTSTTTTTSPPPGTFGDPHFISWGGDYYDYHGICDLLFLESAANNLMVQLRTEKKYHYSYISSAAIKLNDDVFEFGSWGQVIANGVYLSTDSELPATFGGHPMTLTRSNKVDHIYTIDFGDNTGLEVKAFKEMVAVRVLGTSDNFMDARGLMGSPTNGGEKVGRDGAVWTKDLNAFGQEWQVTAEEPNLFQALREPQAPQRCMLPNEMGPSSQLEIRRLGETMARSEAEKACAKWKMNKEACISDVMITGDKDLAEAFFD